MYKLILTLAACLIVGCTYKSVEYFPSQVASSFNTPKSVFLYSISPSKNYKIENINGYPVIGKTKITNTQANKAISELKESVRKWNSEKLKIVSFCFEPRHALEIESEYHSYIVLICYKCHSIEIIENNIEVFSSNANGTSNLLDQLLTSYNIPLASK